MIIKYHISYSRYEIRPPKSKINSSKQVRGVVLFEFFKNVSRMLFSTRGLIGMVKTNKKVFENFWFFEKKSFSKKWGGLILGRVLFRTLRYSKSIVFVNKHSEIMCFWPQNIRKIFDFGIDYSRNIEILHKTSEKYLISIQNVVNDIVFCTQNVWKHCILTWNIEN